MRYVVGLLLLLAAGCTAENPWYDPGLAVDPTVQRYVSPPDLAPPPDLSGECGRVEGEPCCDLGHGQLRCLDGLLCGRKESGAGPLYCIRVD